MPLFSSSRFPFLGAGVLLLLLFNVRAPPFHEALADSTLPPRGPSISQVVQDIQDASGARRRVVPDFVEAGDESGERGVAKGRTSGFGAPRKAQILLFPPILFESHLAIFKLLGKGLQEYGHHLTLFVSDRRRIEDDSPDFSVARFPGIFSTDEAQAFLQSKVRNVLSGRPTFLELFDILNHYAKNCEMIFREGRESLEQLRQHKYDLMVVDSNEMCGFLIALELGIPFVTFSTGMWTPYEAFVPSPISYVPEFNSKLTDRMTFLGRLHNTFMYGVSRFGTSFLIFPKYNNLIRKYQIGMPKASSTYPPHEPAERSLRYRGPMGSPMHIKDFIKECQAWLICTDVALEFPRPMMPQVEYVGGILGRPPKALPLALKTWADASAAQGGFVIVSFGAGVQELDARLENMFVSVLSKLPYPVIWRYGHPIKTNATNIKVIDWIPQNDLLGHPNVRAFLGHGGTNGVYECLFHAVPIVGMPLFGDHYDTMVRVQAKGMGLMLDWKTVTAKQLASALHEVIHNRKYADTIQRYSKIHHDQPMTPLKRAASKIDYVVRYEGAPHLRPAVFDLNLIQFFLLDVQLVFVLAFALLAWGVYLLTESALSRFNFIEALRKNGSGYSRLRNSTDAAKFDLNAPGIAGTCCAAAFFYDAAAGGKRRDLIGVEKDGAADGSGPRVDGVSAAIELKGGRQRRPSGVSQGSPEISDDAAGLPSSYPPLPPSAGGATESDPQLDHYRSPATAAEIRVSGPECSTQKTSSAPAIGKGGEVKFCRRCGRNLTGLWEPSICFDEPRKPGRIIPQLLAACFSFCGAALLGICNRLQMLTLSHLSSGRCRPMLRGIIRCLDLMAQAVRSIFIHRARRSGGASPTVESPAKIPEHQGSLCRASFRSNAGVLSAQGTLDTGGVGVLLRPSDSPMYSEMVSVDSPVAMNVNQTSKGLSSPPLPLAPRGSGASPIKGQWRQARMMVSARQQDQSFQQRSQASYHSQMDGSNTEDESSGHNSSSNLDSQSGGDERSRVVQHLLVPHKGSHKPSHPSRPPPPSEAYQDDAGF